MLCNGIVKRNLFDCSVLAEQILIVDKVYQLVRLVYHVGQFVSEHAAVPQCAAGNILRRHIRRRLFLEGIHRRYMFAVLWNNVAVLFAGIRRLNAHENEVRLALVRLRR